VKLPLYSPVLLLSCESASMADRFGIRIGDRGWVVEHQGRMGCCLTPEDCSCVEFVNDAGFVTRLCVQDCHFAVCRQN
jgi:hypothetical protein